MLVIQKLVLFMLARAPLKSLKVFSQQMLKQTISGMLVNMDLYYIISYLGIILMISAVNQQVLRIYGKVPLITHLVITKTIKIRFILNLNRQKLPILPETFILIIMVNR